jgi:hypothetical protein
MLSREIIAFNGNYLMCFYRIRWGYVRKMERRKGEKKTRSQGKMVFV